MIEFLLVGLPVITVVFLFILFDIEERLNK
jgi:hypothetical protein